MCSHFYSDSIQCNFNSIIQNDNSERKVQMKGVFYVSHVNKKLFFEMEELLIGQKPSKSEEQRTSPSAHHD